MSNLKAFYKKSLILADKIYEIVKFWGPFNQTIIGMPFIKCIDNLSINLNLIEYNKLNKLEYIHKIKNNLIKAASYNDIARRRRLLEKEDYQMIYVELRNLKKILNPIKKSKYKKLISNF